MGFLTALAVMCTLVTAAVLVGGIVSMLRGGRFDERHSEQFMFARVGAQALTLIFMLTAFGVASL